MADEKKTQMSEKLTKIVSEVEKLSVIELSELVKALEEKFGVSAASMAAAPAATTPVVEAAPEQTVFNVQLSEMGANKIAVIKAVRELVPTLGLQEAKTLVESAPKDVLTGVNKKTADEAKMKLEKAGAKVALK